MTVTILESLVSMKINLSRCQFFYWILLRWKSGQRCRYGRFCTYAHGEEELKSWMEYKNEEQENESDEEQTLGKTEREEAISRSEVPLLTLPLSLSLTLTLPLTLTLSLSLSLSMSLSLILSLSFPNAIAIAFVIFIVIVLFNCCSGIFHNTVLPRYFIRKVHESA